MDRHSGGGPPPHLRGRPVSGSEAAHANEYFEPFLNATTLKSILGYHRSMCEFLHLKPNVFLQFYPKLRANLTSWKAKALWKKFDARISHKCYGKGKACSGTRVLIIGAGPCGLRTAIEAQLLGAKVVVVEKRDRLSRNNVLHLWPFVIEDLRMLGAKKFFGKFCAGAIDHISIRQLQCILLKVALLLGVEVHTEVSFEGLIEPSATEKTGWRADIRPENHPVSQYEFDAIIGADGKRNTLQGFKRKEFRGKLAIAITANFINKKTEAEARVEEISGVAFIFNQKFFKDLQEETRIDLENIVYYKDDTHYFVMTAKKASLLEKGVIKQDLTDTEKLLAPENVNREALQNYAREAADFSTNYQLPELEFAVNHYGQPDVAMFDFTSMYAAEYASKVVERHGSRLLMILVGDSLLEPFWPTGSGCARGFLSSLDAAWAIRSYCSGQMTPLDVLAERESIYRLLAQTTPDNLNKDWKAYTLDPATRYPNLNKSVVTPHQTVCLYDTDNGSSIEKMKRASLETTVRQEHIPKKRRRGNVDKDVLLNWLTEQLRSHEEISLTDLGSVFKNGKTLCAIIHHYRPDLLDYSAIIDNEPAKCNQLAMDILERDLGLPPFMTGEEITNTEDYLAMATYLTQVYDTFRGEIPHIKHPKLNVSESLIKSSKLPDENPQLLNIIKRKNSNSADILFTKGGKRVENLKDLLSNNKLKTRTESENRLKEKKPVRKSSSHERPSKVLSEKTFLTTSIKSLKSLEKEFSSHRRSKGDFFDLTYHDDSLDRIPLKKSQKTQIGVDEKRVKKVKSRNVSLYVNLGDVNSASKRKPKVKNSNLSVIPEYIEEKCSENMKNISEEKNNRVKSAPKVQDASVNFGSSVRLFSCETFIQNSYDSHSPPIVASATEQPKEKSIVKLPQGQYFLNNNIGQQKSVISNIARDSGAPLDKLKQTENRFIYGLRNYSPLQIIRRHLLMKKKQLGLILSKQKIVPPFISEVKLPSNISSTTNEEVKTKSTHSSSNESIKIQLIHKSSSNKITCQNIEYKSSRNLVKITSKIPGDFVTNSNSRLIILTDNSQSTKRSNYMEKSYFHGGSGGGEKKIEQIFENKENFLRRNISLAGSMRNDFLPKLQLPKLPDFREKTKKRLQVKKKPSMSCVDKQIINSLGANETSTLKSKRAPRDDHFKKKINFLFQTGIRKTRNCHESLPCDSKKLKMDFFEENHNFTPLVYSRVQNWISQHDFNPDEVKQDTEGTSILSDITSITRAHLNKTGEYDDVKVEQRTYVVKCESSAESSHEDLAELVKTLKDGKSKAIFKDNKSKCKKPLSKFNLKSVSAPPGNFSVITEGEEGSELPENTNQSEFSFKSIKTSNHQLLNTNVVLSSRPSSRHRRHAEGILPKSSSIDKKQRKRRTLERIGPSVIFSRWFLESVLETVLVGIMLLILDIYMNPEEYIDPPKSFLKSLWM